MKKEVKKTNLLVKKQEIKESKAPLSCEEKMTEVIILKPANSQALSETKFGKDGCAY